MDIERPLPIGAGEAAVLRNPNVPQSKRLASLRRHYPDQVRGVLSRVLSAFAHPQPVELYHRRRTLSKVRGCAIGRSGSSGAIRNDGLRGTSRCGG